MFQRKYSKLLAGMAMCCLMQLSGCGSVKVHRDNDANDGVTQTEKLKGIPYYLPRPHLFVKKPFFISKKECVVMAAMDESALENAGAAVECDLQGLQGFRVVEGGIVLDPSSRTTTSYWQAEEWGIADSDGPDTPFAVLARRAKEMEAAGQGEELGIQELDIVYIADVDKQYFLKLNPGIGVLNASLDLKDGMLNALNVTIDNTSVAQMLEKSASGLLPPGAAGIAGGGFTQWYEEDLGYDFTLGQAQAVSHRNAEAAFQLERKIFPMRTERDDGYPVQEHEVTEAGLDHRFGHLDGRRAKARHFPSYAKAGPLHSRRRGRLYDQGPEAYDTPPPVRGTASVVVESRALPGIYPIRGSSADSAENGVVTYKKSASYVVNLLSVEAYTPGFSYSFGKVGSGFKKDLENDLDDIVSDSKLFSKYTRQDDSEDVFFLETRCLKPGEVLEEDLWADYVGVVKGLNEFIDKQALLDSDSTDFELLRSLSRSCYSWDDMAKIKERKKNLLEWDCNNDCARNYKLRAEATSGRAGAVDAKNARLIGGRSYLVTKGVAVTAVSIPDSGQLQLAYYAEPSNANRALKTAMDWGNGSFGFHLEDHPNGVGQFLATRCAVMKEVKEMRKILEANRGKLSAFLDRNGPMDIAPECRPK